MACDDIEGMGLLADTWPMVGFDDDGWPRMGISHPPRNPFPAACGLDVWNGTAGAATDRRSSWIMFASGFRTLEEMERASLVSEFFSQCEW